MLGLSNGICSLNPHVDRLAMVAELGISTDGKLQSSRFYRAVFHSNARLTYNQVADWLAAQCVPADRQKIWPNLTSLYSVFQVLLASRKKRGAID
ncbi:MAG: RNB domain-containing ribonuclease, partial [Verrucomicrobia bacterium]|nr:RNB domain-containing ribonuclease [Verrucomicrobiota bacterium]